MKLSHGFQELLNEFNNCLRLAIERSHFGYSTEGDTQIQEIGISWIRGTMPVEGQAALQLAGLGFYPIVEEGKVYSGLCCSYLLYPVLLMNYEYIDWLRDRLVLIGIRGLWIVGLGVQREYIFDSELMHWVELCLPESVE